MLQSQSYENCIRTEQGYCAIQWKESSTTSPDPFQVGPIATVAANGASGTTCAQYITIPNLSPDGIRPIPVPLGLLAYQTTMCGSNFGIEDAVVSTISTALVCK